MTTLVLAEALRDQAVSLGNLMRDEPEAAEAIFGGFHTEVIDKPSYPIGDGSVWASRKAIITRDGSGQIVSETFIEE